MNRDFTKEILDRLHELLRPPGYKRLGRTFFKSTDDLTYVVSLQSSQKSTVEKLIATVNVYVRSALLYSLEDTSIPEKNVVHYHKRVGDFLNPPSDIWWIIDNPQSLNTAKTQIKNLLEEKVLPHLSDLKTVNDLKQLWQTE